MTRDLILFALGAWAGASLYAGVLLFYTLGRLAALAYERATTGAQEES